MTLWTRLSAFARRIADDARGNAAMLFGLALPGLILMTLGGVDIHRVSTVRINLQDALDAAALAAARSTYTADVDIQRVGMDALRANLAAYPQVTLLTAGTTFRLNDEKIVIADARANVKTLVANIFLPPYGQFMDDYLPVGAHSEVNRSARNVEVAMVLDTTGSMAGQRIIDLRAAAKQLVDIVVQPEQTPWYSKVAVVPYSMAVNVDSHAGAARGDIRTSTTVTNATWTTGPVKDITGATKARPVVITSNGHGFQNGDVVWITGVNGMTSLNKKAYVVTNRSDNTFELYRNGSRVDGREYSSYSSGGKIQKCQTSDCSVVITSANHGLSNNDYVYFSDVGGMTELNGDTFLVGNATTNTFTIDLQASSSLSAYTSGGKAWCAQEGCTYFAFENRYDDLVTQKISTCVTERTGPQAWTDASPTLHKVGRNYPSGSNPCLTNTLRPLTSDKATLKDQIDALTASGSTGGHIGVAWGWYALSPNFSGLFGSNAGGAYDPTRTLKAVIIMTDGEYNSGYCKGVIAKNSTAGSGDTTKHINCDAPNGHPFDQTLALCAAMKSAGVVVYTVGFQVVDDERARTMVNQCASSSNHVHMASSGTALSDAFAAIGRDIMRLRISK
ncbi:ubiquitin-activating E1 FCCH domain-containing protein [Brevundimonas sp.]|jgi:Flp pilus assembly protein TadG|uniref:ubiquitin-activating E1 FCCH domain-containing protein n=1 Tax=Brevundimonas sp. TaxID=1871086 RepID=UPI002E0F3866|nr:ubiquitin-activating E1 FCCH domain-containing protein [Brevundimonas sp.]